MNVKVYKIAGDGQCLFNSLAYGFLFHVNKKRKITVCEYKNLASRLREMCSDRMMKYIESNNRKIMQLLSASLDNFENTNEKSVKKRAMKYVKHMKKKSTWGGNIEIKVIGDHFKKYGFRGIQVLDDDDKVINHMGTKINKIGNEIIYIKLIGVKMGGHHFNFVDVIS